MTLSSDCLELIVASLATAFFCYSALHFYRLVVGNPWTGGA